jgi:hypothetical protein
MTQPGGLMIAPCIENACRDRRPRIIQVSMADGLLRTYRSGDSSPLAFAQDQPVRVDSVFVDEARDGIV